MSEEITVRNRLGVCSAEEDTRLLAEVCAHEAPAGGRVLEIGTGTGYVAIHLARLGRQVDATEISAKALRLAEENAAVHGVSVRFWLSDLFAAVPDRYHLIAFNPPMNPAETELTRLITSFLRRHQRIANFFMRAFDRWLESSRLPFLIDFVEQAGQHLEPGGRIVLELTKLEIDDLERRLPGYICGRRVDIPRLPTEQIAVFWPRQDGAA